MFKYRVHEFTGAGPGVGVTNHDVQYHIAEVILVTNINYYIFHHLANGNSIHNEVQRIQSYVCDVIGGGGPLNWKYKKQYEELSDGQLEGMTFEKLEQNELERMKFNAFKVCNELSLRIDGATEPKNYMKAYTSEKSEDLFFNNHADLKKYLPASEKNKVGPVCSRIPKPFPNYNASGMYYLDVLKTYSRLFSTPKIVQGLFTWNQAIIWERYREFQQQVYYG